MWLIDVITCIISAEKFNIILKLKIYESDQFF